MASAKSLRSQLRRARARGVVVHRVSAPELAPGTDLRRRAEAVVERWLRTRHLPPMAFAAAVEPFAHLEESRVLIARQGDDVVGLAVARPLPLPASSAAPSAPSAASSPASAWLIELVLRTREAPNGTAELLVDATLTALAADGVERATLGLAPLHGRVPGALALVRHTTRGLFDFQGLADFKQKLRPQRWRRVLVEHPGQGPVLGTLRVLRAFAGGSFVGFGVRTALRGPPPLLRLVAALLVPWLIGLAVIDERFFPRREVQLAWVAFDLALVPALFWLARRITRRRRRRWLHVLLAVVITLDALVTGVQAALWNLPRSTGAGDIALVLAACAAPALVAVLLWTSLRHRG